MLYSSGEIGATDGPDASGRPIDNTGKGARRNCHAATQWSTDGGEICVKFPEGENA